MKDNFKKLTLLIIIFSLFLSAGFCSAAFLRPEAQTKINYQASHSGFFGGYEAGADVYALAQTVINAFLAIVGVLLLIYLLHAGYKWMTAHGEEEKVEQAKDTIKRAITGIIIIVGAYAISVFVMSRLEAGTLKGGTTTSLPVTNTGE